MLETCKASKKVLQGINYFAAVAGEAFDVLKNDQNKAVFAMIVKTYWEFETCSILLKSIIKCTLQDRAYCWSLLYLCIERSKKAVMSRRIVIWNDESCIECSNSEHINEMNEFIEGNRNRQELLDRALENSIIVSMSMETHYWDPYQDLCREIYSINIYDEIFSILIGHEVFPVKVGNHSPNFG